MSRCGKRLFQQALSSANKSAYVNRLLLEEKRRLRNKPGMEKRYAEPIQAALSIVFNL